MSISDADITARLPLTPAVFYILLTLAGQERHGYAIMQEVAARTAGQIHLGPGTLYGTLKRLVASGLVAETTTRPVAANEDERRRYYVLTDLGQRVAAAEAARLRDLVDLAVAKHLLPTLGGVS